MNTQRVLRFPMIELVIAALILLAVGGFAALIVVTWQFLRVPSTPSPIQADPLKMVDTFHSAINSDNVDAVLALFADDATVTDNGSVIDGKEEIRNWMLYSQRMAGLRLTQLKSEMDGEKVIWLDTAHNGLEVERRFYILRWEALTRDGKIQSLAAMPRYMPDLK